MSLANISSQPLSVGTAGDMFQSEVDMEMTTPNAGEMGECKEVNRRKTDYRAMPNNLLMNSDWKNVKLDESSKGKDINIYAD